LLLVGVLVAGVLLLLVVAGLLAQLVAGESLPHRRLGPGRDRLVPDPADSTWTSHHFYIGLANPPPWLDVQLGLSLCGFDSSPRGRRSFHDFVRSVANRPRDSQLSGDGLLDLRARVRQALGAPVEVGGPQLSQNGELVCSPLSIEQQPIRPKWQGPLTDLLEMVAAATGIGVDNVISRRRTDDVVHARRVFVCAAHQFLGFTVADASAQLGISRQAASKLLNLCTAPGEAVTAEAHALAKQARARTS